MKFTKMHGLGNDFIVIDAINQKINLSKQDIRQLSRRDIGIGFDQCLLIEKSNLPNIDFFYRIFNADGTEVGQCGNGARCLARFIEHYNLTDKKLINVATQTTNMQLKIHPDQSVSVIFPVPKIGESHTINLQSFKTIDVGNPHAVINTNTWPLTDINYLGQEISTHKLFPEQINVGFMYINNPSHIYLRVFERGCGETRACGSGAVAAMAIGRLYFNLDANVTVSLPGGDLNIIWPDINGEIELRGPAILIYEGVVPV